MIQPDDPDYLSEKTVAERLAAIEDRWDKSMDTLSTSHHEMQLYYCNQLRIVTYTIENELRAGSDMPRGMLIDQLRYLQELAEGMIEQAMSAASVSDEDEDD